MTFELNYLLGTHSEHKLVTIYYLELMIHNAPIFLQLSGKIIVASAKELFFFFLFAKMLDGF